MSNYKIGNIVKGKVTGVENYGIFLLVDDNVTGLIHISEISDNFVKDVNDYAKVGDVLEAEVIEYDEDNKKLKLSLKSMFPSKGKKEGIIETKSGFTKLGNELNNWIEKKEQELSKK